MKFSANQSIVLLLASIMSSSSQNTVMASASSLRGGSSLNDEDHIQTDLLDFDEMEAVPGLEGTQGDKNGRELFSSSGFSVSFPPVVAGSKQFSVDFTIPPLSPTETLDLEIVNAKEFVNTGKSITKSLDIPIAASASLCPGWICSNLSSISFKNTAAARMGAGNFQARLVHTTAQGTASVVATSSNYLKVQLVKAAQCGSCNGCQPCSIACEVTFLTDIATGNQWCQDAVLSTI